MDNTCESIVGRWEAVPASRHVGRLPWSGYNCNVEVFRDIINIIYDGSLY